MFKIVAAVTQPEYTLNGALTVMTSIQFMGALSATTRMYKLVPKIPAIKIIPKMKPQSVLDWNSGSQAAFRMQLAANTNVI